MFLENFFLASRTVTIRKEICRIHQHSGETLHEYWERFNKLCATCLHHQISEYLLLYFANDGQEHDRCDKWGSDEMNLVDLSPPSQSQPRRVVPARPLRSRTSRPCGPATQSKVAQLHCLRWQPSSAPKANSAATSLRGEACNARCRIRTERPKVGRGDHLAGHRTLLNLILSDLANRGSLDGQNPSGSKAPNLEHGKQYAIVRD
ncbi:hypothetical protein CR513_08988, partial [Mucuna pruriens]